MLEFTPTTFGDYILQDRIGAGGMAEIFLATAQGIEGFEKRLVLKRILPTLSDDEQFVRMFVEEAKLCVSLHHPNIVQVYDLGLIAGQYYIAMEYVDGRDLLKTLAACGRQKVGFPTDIALYIVMEVLKGLDYAHKLTKDGRPLGIIHRDVSPSNVLLSFEGEVKLGDFGIAKARTRERTATGILKGKFGYMAPEQVTGVPIDYKADVFAVGILLYELLTGHRLFAGKNDLAVLERVRNADISPPPRYYRQDLDYELEHIVMKALAREPSDRFGDCMELHDAIHDYVFRSRATVGPAQLGRFMQALFLTDPEEQARRLRVRLPPIPGGPDPLLGMDDTEDERSAPEEQGITGDGLAMRRESSITDGRELIDAPVVPQGRAKRPHRAATDDDLEFEATDESSLGRPRRRGPGEPRRRFPVGGRSTSSIARLPSVTDGQTGFAPSEIVERAVSKTDVDLSEPSSLPPRSDAELGDVESTVRVDPADTREDLASPVLDDSMQTTAPQVMPSEAYRADQPRSASRTLSIEDSDLPTAEVESLVPGRGESGHEMDETVLNRDQHAVIQKVLAAAAAVRTLPQVEDPSVGLDETEQGDAADHGPIEATLSGLSGRGFDLADDATPFDPLMPDPAEDAFVERTLANADQQEYQPEDRFGPATAAAGPAFRDIVGPPSEPSINVVASDPRVRTGSSQEPTHRRPPARTGPEVSSAAVTDPEEPWAERTLAQPASTSDGESEHSAPERDPEATDDITMLGTLDDDGPRLPTDDAVVAALSTEEPSVPAITDAGRLGDAGASGLFGALSVLDEPVDFEQQADEDQSLETVGRFYADFSDSMGRVEAVSGDDRDDERLPSDVAQNAAYGETRMGMLADPIDDASSPSFPLDSEEPTSAGDGQSLLLSPQLHSELPEPESFSLVRARTSSVSGLDLEFDIDRSHSTVNDDEREFSGGGAGSRPPEEPTDEERALDEQGRRDTPLIAIGADLGPIEWPAEDPVGKVAGLVSESFELHLEHSVLRPRPDSEQSAESRDDGEIGPPVRPVSMVDAPGGVDETFSQVAVAPSRVGPRGAGGSAALRAVVGRRGRIRELNRANQPRPPTDDPGAPRARHARQPQYSSGTPHPSTGTPGPTQGSHGARTPPGPAFRAQPSAGIRTGGTPSGPAAFIVQRPRSGWLTIALYGLPLVAVFLTVAALVSSVVLRERQPVYEDHDFGRLVPPPGGDEGSTDDPATDRGSAEAPPDRSPARPEGEPPPRSASPAGAQADPSGPQGAAAVPPRPRGQREPGEQGRRRSSRRKRAETGPKARRDGRGRIRVRCDRPTLVRIVGVGSYRADPQLIRRLRPGDYQIKLSRSGEQLSKVVIQVVAGHDVKIPCP